MLPSQERLTLLERFMHLRLVRRLFALPFMQRVMLPARGDRVVHKFIRYSMVSGVAIFISQVVIVICVGPLHLSGIVSNTLGVIASTPASYELNRKWAWGKSGKSHMWREVVPFWTMTLIGYLASTGTVQLADTSTTNHDVGGVWRVVAIMAASLFAWGVVWVVKFVVFNKLVFVTRPGDDLEDGGSLTSSAAGSSAAGSSAAVDGAAGGHANGSASNGHVGPATSGPATGGAVTGSAAAQASAGGH